MFKRMTRGILIYRCHLFTTSRLINDILDSQFHSKGQFQYQNSIQIELQNLNNLQAITDIQLKLNQNRQIYHKNILAKQPIQKILNQYGQNYQKLIKTLQNYPINHPLITRYISWYNIRSLYRDIIQKMMKSDQKQLQTILESLSISKHNWKNDYGLIDNDLILSQTLSNFYKRLSLSLSIKQLRQLSGILVTNLHMNIRNYYQIYNRKNLKKIIKQTKIQNQQSISDLIWLFWKTITTMNDQPQFTDAIQKYIINYNVKLRKKDIDLLMQLYTLKGRINKEIYNKHIKPHIYRYRMAQESSLINVLKFTVCSQCNDDQLLRSIYELIEVRYQKRGMQAKTSSYFLHLYTNYLRYKGYKIILPLILQNDLNHKCRQNAKGRHNLHTHIHDNKELVYKIKAKQPRSFISPCLEVAKSSIRMFNNSRRSSYEQQFLRQLKELDLKDTIIHQKPVFCSYELDYVIQQKEKQLLDCQIQGIQYTFASGALIRQRQIRDQILQYYGFKVVHLNYSKTQTKEKTSIDRKEWLLNEINSRLVSIERSGF